MAKKSLCVLIFLCAVLNNWAQQNLVPNYSFENYSSCPPNWTSIGYATPWFQPNYPLAGVNGSSDFYHTCNCPTFGCPPNSAGYQYPRTGEGLVGIAFYFDSTNTNKDKWREYIEVGLSDSLVENKKYCIRFYSVKGNWSSYAVKNIQAVLTNDSLLYNDPDYGFISFVTPILEADNIIYDTLNWIPIQTTLTANGGERFLTIGNFSSGSSTVFDYVWPFNGSPNTLGYYLIDDVSVYQLPDYNAGNDTTICPWDTMQIGPATTRADVQYSWSPTAGLDNPNIANPLASPLVNTTYILTVTDTCQWACNSILKDTINISVNGCLGVEKIDRADLHFELYPNPNNGKFFIENKVGIKSEMDIKIYNTIGEILFTTNFNSTKTEIDLTNFSNGIYFVEVNGDDIIWRGKIVKE